MSKQDSFLADWRRGLQSVLRAAQIRIIERRIRPSTPRLSRKLELKVAVRYVLQVANGDRPPDKYARRGRVDPGSINLQFCSTRVSEGRTVAAGAADAGGDGAERCQTDGVHVHMLHARCAGSNTGRFCRCFCLDLFCTALHSAYLKTNFQHRSTISAAQYHRDLWRNAYPFILSVWEARTVARSIVVNVENEGAGGPRAGQLRVQHRHVGLLSGGEPRRRSFCVLFVP